MTFNPTDKKAARHFLEQLDICNNDTEIMGRDGRFYHKKKFNSALHELFVIKLKDHQKAHQIWQSYARHVLPQVNHSPKLQEIVEKWLEEHMYMLLCDSNKHLEVLNTNEALRPLLPYFKLFFGEIACKEHTHISEKAIHKIAIITTSGAGGELMVAKAIEKYLAGRFELMTIDTDMLSKGPVDFLYQFSCGFSSTDIYGDVFQKENNSDLADNLWWKCELLRKFLVDDSNRMLKEKVQRFKPNLILSTRYFSPSEVALAYDLNVPLRYIHCDYKFCPDLLPIADKVNTCLVKFWVPTKECIPRSLNDGRVEVLGYPIRLGIIKESDSQKVELIRQKLNLKPNEQVIMLMMGRQGMGKVLLPLIQKIHAADGALGCLHVAVICGNNMEMKAEIENYLTTVKHTRKQISFHVYGFMDESMLSNYYNVANVFVGKAGGATTGELVHMKVHALICKSYELEVPNLKYLVDIGLGLELILHYFIDQLKTLLERSKEGIELSTSHWQRNLDRLLISAQRDVAIVRC